MLFIICGNGFAYAQTFNEMPIPAFTLHKEMKTPQIFKLPEIKNTLSETNPAFNNSMPLVKQYELRKKFSYLDPVFTGYFNQQQYRLFNSRYFGYELYGSSYSLQGVGTQNMAGGRLVYRLNRQLAIRIGGNAYQYRSNGRMFNDFTLNADLTYRLNNWLTAYIYGQLRCTRFPVISTIPLRRFIPDKPPGKERIWSRPESGYRQKLQCCYPAMGKYL